MRFGEKIVLPGRWLILFGTLCFYQSCNLGRLDPVLEGESGSDTDTDTDTDTDMDAGSRTRHDAGNSDDTSTNTNQAVCDENNEQNIDLILGETKVLFVVDRSNSMRGDRWNEVSKAIENTVTIPRNTNMMFGLQAFPTNHTLYCPKGDEPQVQIAKGTGETIATWMKDNDFPVSIAWSPLISTLNYHVTQEDSPLNDPNTDNYIIVISDGADDCFDKGNVSVTNIDKTNLLAGITDNLKDRFSIKTFAIGFGNVSTETGQQLNGIAKNGGTSLDTYVPAPDGPALEEALADILETVRSCRYHIDSPLAQLEPFKVNFYFDNQLILRDRTHKDGWDWQDDGLLEVTFYGNACNHIRNNLDLIVRATFGCPTKLGEDSSTCAMHELFLDSKTVGVMILQDFSGSMNTNNKWTNATRAITKMVADDRNNDVEFGFNPFPNDGIECDDVDDDPLISVTRGPLNRLSIIEWIVNNTPNGLADTPLLLTLEKLNTHPGRLGDTSLDGVVIIISDGADSCSGSNDTPSLLAVATDELVRTHDLRVFAVGFGLDVNKDELNAIASSGNTELTTFQKAGNDAELEEVLSHISSMVRSCILEVPYAGANVDYDMINLYFDGEIVPRDTSHKSGWDWVNSTTKKEIELKGETCGQLQGGQVQKVVIEFGCTTQFLV